MARWMVVSLAVVACAAEFLTYAFACALVGLTKGGGVVGMMIIFGIMLATWQTIVRYRQTKKV